MKTIFLLILVLCLLQPVASFAHPCVSYLNNQSSVDPSGNSETAPLHQDADITDCSDCSDDNMFLKYDITISHMPLVVVIILPERNSKRLKIIMPIFVPPQNLA